MHSSVGGGKSAHISATAHLGTIRSNTGAGPAGGGGGAGAGAGGGAGKGQRGGSGPAPTKGTRPGVAFGGQAGGRGLHSFTFQLNLSRV